MMYDKVSWKANYNLVGYLVKLKFHSPLKMRSRVFFLKLIIVNQGGFLNS